MKKLIIFLLTVVTLCAALSVCAFAEEQAELKTEVTYKGQAVSVTRFENFTVEEMASSLNNSALLQRQNAILDENAIVVLQDAQGNLSAYPSYYIIELSSQGGNGYVAISEINYGFINKMLGETRFPSKQASIVSIEFPKGLTSLRANSVFGTNHSSGYETIITEMYVPNTVTSIESNSFKNCGSLESVYFEEGSTIAEIVSGSFTNCKKLSYFEFEKLTGLKKVNGFGDTGFKRLDLSQTSIEIIGSGAFSGAAIEYISLPNTVKRIEGTAFSKAKITEFTMPENLEYYGDNVFEGASRFTLTSGILPSNLTYVGTYFMANTVLPNLIVFPKGVTQLPKETFGNAYVHTSDEGNRDLTLVFLGKMTNFDADGNDYRKWADRLTVYFAQNTISEVNASVYSFSDKAQGTLGTSSTQSGSLTLDVSNSTPNYSQISDEVIEIIFCGNNGSVEQSYIIRNDGSAITEDRGMFDMENHICYAFSDNENDCTADTICIVCDVNKANESHNFAETVVFNSLIEKGIKSQACQNPGCLVAHDGIELEPIVVCLGYSVSKFGTPSITQGFLINEVSLDEYISAGNSFDFGLVAGAVSVSTNEPLEIKDDAVSLKQGIKAIAVGSNKLSTDAFEIKITNLASEHFNTPFILEMYVVANGKIMYISEGDESDVAHSVTYLAHCNEE